MQVTIEIPDAVVARLKLNGRSVSRELLEAFAVEGYGTEKLSRGQVSELLGLNYWETEEVLRQHGAFLHYDLGTLSKTGKPCARRSCDDRHLRHDCFQSKDRLISKLGSCP